VTLRAPQAAGLFYGVQTLLQLLPTAVPGDGVQVGPWELPTLQIQDKPRFAWRGAMLDVARHFFAVGVVKRYIDLLAQYKMNRLHLHLSDDQGWRIEIKSWNKLATVGGSRAVGDDPGGYYTQAEYADLVAYAARRFITIVPEIDLPGHTNAALASYPELNCNDIAPALYTGIGVGFSSLCTAKPVTYQFVDDVIRELAALTPGPYLHIGGDEAAATPEADYIGFIERVQEIVHSHGKQMVGWEEVAKTKLLPTSIAQQWTSNIVQKAVAQGARVILSPASRTYLDMQYDASTPRGLHWAGYVDVRKAYDWEPATEVEGIPAESILGVEAPLWSETLRTLDDITFMALPRLAGIAEIGWSPHERRDWADYSRRLAAHGTRWTSQGFKFYHSPQVPWLESFEQRSV
jgi:hexosaminidase